MRPDADIFCILELRDAGFVFAAIAERFGMTTGGVCILVNKIKRETESSKHDGTMPYGWWREGLRKRKENDN